MNRGKRGENMKRRIISLLIVLSVMLIPSRVFASPGSWGYSGPSFDKSTYTLGSKGTVTLSHLSSSEAAEISFVGIDLYFIKVDGSISRIFAGKNYGDTPIYLPANVELSLSYEFQIPLDSDIVSGYIYHTTTILIRDYGEIRYSSHTSFLYKGAFISNPSLATYSTLRIHYDSLQSSYDDLQNQYNTYKQSHNYSNTEYNQLKQNYDTYMQSHSYTDSQYESLQASYEDLKSKYTGLGEPATASILNYILFMTTTVFLVTTLYFALRKPETKQVS